MALQRTHIVVHHSATKDSGTVSWGAIERYHVETQGWRDIGYHAGVELVEGRYYAMLGRAEDQSAAATREAGMNQVGLHVCCVGDYDASPPRDEMLAVLVKRIIRPWMIRYNIAEDHIIGHRDAGLMEGHDWRRVNAAGTREYKTCPGEMFDLDVLKQMTR